MVKRHLRKYRKGNKDSKCSRCIVSNCSDTHTHIWHWSFKVCINAISHSHIHFSYYMAINSGILAV